VTWDSKRYPYLARVTWHENAPLTLLVQNREQTEEQLLAADPGTGKTTTLLLERDSAWLNLWNRAPTWLGDGSGFLWISERGGEPRLALYDHTGRLLRWITPSGFGLRELMHVDDSRKIAWVLAGAEPTERHLVRLPLDPAQGKPQSMTREP